MIGSTPACALKLFRNTVALEKDDEHISFINMRIRSLRECPNQDEEVGAKHIAFHSSEHRSALLDKLSMFFDKWLVHVMQWFPIVDYHTLLK